MLDVVWRDHPGVAPSGLLRRAIPPPLGRWASHASHPRHRTSVRAERRAESLHLRGIVHVVLDVVLARPYDFHRNTRALRQLDRFDDEVLVRAPTESTAQVGDVCFDLLERNTGE